MATKPSAIMTRHASNVQTACRNLSNFVGITTYESLSYIALNTIHKMTPISQLADTTGITRTKLYTVTDSLVKIGLISIHDNALPAKPRSALENAMEFTSTPFPEVRRFVESDLNSHIAEYEKRGEMIISEFANKKDLDEQGVANMFLGYGFNLSESLILMRLSLAKDKMSPRDIAKNLINRSNSYSALYGLEAAGYVKSHTERRSERPMRGALYYESVPMNEIIAIGIRAYKDQVKSRLAVGEALLKDLDGIMLSDFNIA